ncbi:hypothetical protein DOTSEDRAFT_74619 [Dothistroma septosporum NZE10]|uniref:Uncharacterized protein n=1 Tax=Dothistroma septosporum (strain NZE10 / CBS 128990) TaxID=675120 RepID=N1PCN4_DOTSN|nr:hypothetical protein DOTSEDRAFT_74619 [Dothistroma septosporum NZE10]
MQRLRTQLAIFISDISSWPYSSATSPADTTTLSPSARRLVRRLDRCHFRELADGVNSKTAIYRIAADNCVQHARLLHRSVVHPFMTRPEDSDDRSKSGHVSGGSLRQDLNERQGHWTNPQRRIADAVELTRVLPIRPCSVRPAIRRIAEMSPWQRHEQSSELRSAMARRSRLGALSPQKIRASLSQRHHKLRQ